MNAGPWFGAAIILGLVTYVALGNASTPTQWVAVVVLGVFGLRVATL